MPKVQRNEPPYVQVMDHFRRLILDGTLSEGDKLPPVAEIGREWGISTATAGRAISQLQVEGYVRTTPQGTFVEVLPAADTPRDRMARVRRAGRAGPESEMVIVRNAGLERIPVYVAELMDLDPAGEVIRREWTTVAGRRPLAVPVAFSVAWYDPELASQIPDILQTHNSSQSRITAKIEDVTGRTVTHGEDHLQARASDAREAAALGIPVGSPIMAGAYLWVGADGRVVEYGEFCLPPGRKIRYAYDVESQ